jgi:hypothetical protein
MTTPLSERQLNLEEFFDGDLVAYGQFQDILGNVSRRFTVEIDGTWDGETLRLVEDFVYEDGSTEQRIWTLRKTGPTRGRAPRRASSARPRGAKRGTCSTGDTRSTCRSPATRPCASASMTGCGCLSDDRLLNRAYMSRFGVPIGEVIITFERR